MGGLIWEVMRKDLRVEWRSREVWWSGMYFVVLLATLFLFGLYREDGGDWQTGAGAMWIALVFVSNIVFNRSFGREREDGCFEALRLVPGVHRPLFLGKWLSNLLVLGGLEVLLVIMVAVVFRLPLLRIGPSLSCLLLLGTVGMCALGTVIGAALAYVRLREILLPLVLFPLLIPLLVAGVRGTVALLQGEGGVYGDWCRLMIAFDVLYGVLSLWLFRQVVEARG